LPPSSAKWDSHTHPHAGEDLKYKLEGFKSGSDDYLAKPFEIPELQARIEALLRRAYKAPYRPLTRYELDGVHIDFIKSIVSKDEKTTILRKRERELLRYLMERKGRVLSRDEIIQAVWTHTPLRTRTVDVHIAWLRQKIECDPKNPQYIITVHGEGYRFTRECSARERLSGKV
jgi:two-component system alkaline phosphatase synthesis response regulator PhoP